MHLFNRIRPEENTLDYLKAVSRLLRQFMRNYRIGILIFIPLVVLGSIFFGQWWVSGDLRTDLWQQPAIWLLLVLGIVAGILFSRWWLRFWVHTFYGSKLQEIEEIIRDLSDSK